MKLKTGGSTNKRETLAIPASFKSEQVRYVFTVTSKNYAQYKRTHLGPNETTRMFPDTGNLSCCTEIAQARPNHLHLCC